MEIRIKRADVTDLDKLMQWREVVLREVFSIIEVIRLKIKTEP